MNAVDCNCDGFDSQNIANTLVDFEVDIVDDNANASVKNILLNAVENQAKTFGIRHIVDGITILDQLGFYWENFSDNLQEELSNVIMANKFRFKDLEILQLEMQLHRLQVPESVHEYLDLKNKNKDKNNDSNNIRYNAD